MQQFTNSIACYMQLGLYKSTLNLSDFACSYFTSCVPPTPLQSSEWILLPFVLAWFIILNRQITGSVKIKIYKQPQGGSEASGWVQAIKALKFRRHIFQSLRLHFCLEVICCSNALYLKDVWFVYNLKGSTLNYTQYEQKHLLREWDLNHRVLDKLLEIKLQRLFQILLDWGEGRGASGKYNNCRGTHRKHINWSHGRETLWMGRWGDESPEATGALQTLHPHCHVLRVTLCTIWRNQWKHTSHCVHKQLNDCTKRK